MKQIVGSILILLLARLAYSQESSNPVHFSVFVNPQWSTAFFKEDPLESYHASPGMMAGGNLMIHLSYRFQLLTGLEYQIAKYNYRDYSPNFPGDVINGEADVYKSYWNYDYGIHAIGVPFQIKYNLNAVPSANHFFLLAGANLRYQILSEGYVELIEGGNPTGKDKLDDLFFKPEKTLVLGSLHFGYEWKLKNKSLSAGPTFEYSPGWLYQDQHSSAIANAHPAFFGLRLVYF
jgi:hypothetical protein